MSVDLARMLFDFCLLLFSFSVMSLLLVAVFHFLLPAKLLETYFKPPYFSQGEVVAFSGFPLGYIRTIMFLRLLGFPSSGERRGLTKAYEMVPEWMCILAKWTVFSLVVSNLLLIMLLLGFFFFA